MREEIQDQLIADHRASGDKGEDAAEQEGPTVELAHSYFNFNPMIRKIKIDKFSGRKACPSKATDYLDKLTRPA